MGRRCVPGLGLLLVVWMGAGCSHDLTELYDEGAVSPTPDSLLPQHGRVRYRDVQGCQACFDSACAAEAMACQVNPACRRVQDCLRFCRNPDCNWRCYGEQESLDPYPNSQVVNHPLYDALLSCRDSRCPAACENDVDRYGCVGEYDAWRSLLSRGLERIRFPTGYVDGVGRPVVGAELNVCAQTEGPCAPIATAQTSTLGRASLAFSAGASPIGTLALYLEAPETPGGPIGTLLYPPNGLFEPGVRYGLQNFTRSQARSLELVPGVPAWPSFALGAIAVVGFACDGSPARGLVLEVEAAGSAARTFYFDGDAMGVTGARGLAVAQSVEPGLRTVHLRLPEASEPMLSLPVQVRPATLTIVWTSPPGR